MGLGNLNSSCIAQQPQNKPLPVEREPWYEAPTGVAAVGFYCLCCTQTATALGRNSLKALPKMHAGPCCRGGYSRPQPKETCSRDCSHDCAGSSAGVGAPCSWSAVLLPMCPTGILQTRSMGGSSSGAQAAPLELGVLPEGNDSPHHPGPTAAAVGQGQDPEPGRPLA